MESVLREQRKSSEKRNEKSERGIRVEKHRLTSFSVHLLGVFLCFQNHWFPLSSAFCIAFSPLLQTKGEESRWLKFCF